MTIKFNNKHSAYLEEQELERRIKFLENLMYERAFNRNGSKSRTYIIWELLRDQGPLTRPEIRNRLGYTTPVLDLESDGAVTKEGNKYVANLDFVWEDRPDTSAGRNSKSSKSNKQSDLESTNFAKVVAAAESLNLHGSDYNEYLEKICSNPKQTRDTNKIIHYFLEHGADASSYGNAIIYDAICNCSPEAIVDLVDHGANLYRVGAVKRSPFCSAFEIELPNGRKELAKILINLIPDSEHWDSYELHTYVGEKFITNLITYVNEGIISVNIGKELLTVVISKCNTQGLERLAATEDVVRDLTSAKPFMFDTFVSMGVLPRLNHIQLYNCNNTNVLKKVYKAFNLVDSGKIYLNNNSNSLFMKTVIAVCEALNKPIHKVAFKSVDIEAINNLINHNKFYEAADIIKALYDMNQRKALERIANGHIEMSNSDKQSFVHSILLKFDDVASDTLMAPVIKIIDQNMPVNFKPDSYRIICNIFDFDTNKYLEEYLLEHDAAQLVAKYCKDTNRMLPTSLENVQVTRDNNQEVANAVSDIIILIEKDEWSRDAENVITQHPEILFDKRIQDALDKADDDNATARQLLRRIEQLPKSVKDAAVDLYDL